MSETFTSPRVVYPHGGRHFILQWWTHNEQLQVILARSQSNLNDTARIAFDKFQDVRLHDFCEIEIVGPSPEMCREAAVYDREEAIEGFYREVADRLHEALKAGRALPPGFAVCSKYEPPEGWYDSKNQWALENHVECKNCKERIQLTHHTFESLYDRYHEAWKEENPSRYHDKVPHVMSRALPALDREPMWYAFPNFGHHSRGVELIEIKESDYERDHNDEYTSRPSFLRNEVLFFFRRVRDLDRTYLDTVLKERQAAAKASLRQRDAKFRKDRERETKEQIDKALSFFTREADERTCLLRTLEAHMEKVARE